MKLEVIIFSLAFLSWMFSMPVARNKSWKVLDITKFANAVYIVLPFIPLAIILAIFPVREFTFDHQVVFAPFVIIMFYLLYAIIPSLGGSRKDLFKINKWNGLVLLTSSVLAVIELLVFGK